MSFVSLNLVEISFKLVYFNFKQASKVTIGDAIYSSFLFYIDSNTQFDIFLKRVTCAARTKTRKAFLFHLPFLHQIGAYFHFLLCRKWNHEQKMTDSQRPKPPPPRSFTASTYIFTGSQSFRWRWCWTSKTSITRCQTASPKIRPLSYTFTINNLQTLQPKPWSSTTCFANLERKEKLFCIIIMFGCPITNTISSCFCHERKFSLYIWKQIFS